MLKLVEEMRSAAENGELKELTLSVFSSLIGKRIQTFSYGFDGQDNADDFIVGELISLWDLSGKPETISRSLIKRMKEKMCIVSSSGRNTHIMLNNLHGVFCCGDEDRFILYRIIE